MSETYSPLFQLGPDHDPLPQADLRGRARREGARREMLVVERERDHGARRTGDDRHQPSAASRPSRAARENPRRSRGDLERQVRRLRSLEERQYRRRRRAADVPGHRHRDRRRQEGPPRLDGRRRRGRDRGRHPRGLREEEPALQPGRAALDVRGEEHRRQSARADRDLVGGRGRLQIPVHRQGRRLGQQDASSIRRRRRS